MGTNIRKAIARKLFEAADNGKLNPAEFIARAIPSLQLKSSNNGQPEFQFKISSLKKSINDPTVSISDILSKVLTANYHETSAIASVNSNDKNLIFHLNESPLISSILANATENPIDYRLIDEPAQNIIVEYSSPNIAKPFHIGHLRSTIIGNFIANVFDTYGHNVTRINYLGDWGTQFGYLKLGMEMSNCTDEEIAQDPIRHLFNGYVQANRKAESDPEFALKARSVFSQMENGNLPDLDAWHQYRRYTVKEMAAVYGRLGVKFDIYAWESDYRKVNILEHLEQMRKSGFLQLEPDGKESFVLDENTRSPILKSDGSTLYLTRDIAAIIDRQDKFQFDRMFYVAGNEQHQHFDTLFKIAKKLGIRNADKLHHVKFGKVEKMSTRKGNVVFLNDILDEMRDLMFNKQMMSPNTKVDLQTDGKRTADIEGVSAIIAYELQRMPTASYEFDMDNIVNDVNSSAKNFQITHSRLCSLESVNSVSPANEYDPNYLHEPEAIQLIMDIARLPDVLYESKRILAAQRLLNYTFSLNTKTKRALKALPIKGDSNANRQSQRMLLFRAARNALRVCMKIISVTPLDKI